MTRSKRPARRAGANSRMSVETRAISIGPQNIEKSLLLAILEGADLIEPSSNTEGEPLPQSVFLLVTLDAETFETLQTWEAEAEDLEPEEDDDGVDCEDDGLV